MLSCGGIFSLDSVGRGRSLNGLYTFGRPFVGEERPRGGLPLPLAPR